MRKTYLFTALATLLSTFSVQSQDAGRVEVGSFDLIPVLDYETNARHKVKTSIDWEEGHDDRGTRFSIGNGNELNSPDQYTHTGPGVYLRCAYRPAGTRPVSQLTGQTHFEPQYT